MTDSPDIEPSGSADDKNASRHHVSVDSDQGILDDTLAAVPEPTLEMPDPAPEGEEETDALGGPDDPSDEQPVLVVDATLPSGSGEVPALEPEPPSELQSAYDCLEIRTPIEELQTFTRARLETLVRLGEAERAERTKAALALGLSALREVMGAVSKESS